MILLARNRKPSATFGLGKIEMTVPVGTVVPVWLFPNYNEKEYVCNLVGMELGDGLVKEIISQSQTTVTSAAPGVWELRYYITNMTKKIEHYSNTVTITFE